MRHMKGLFVIALMGGIALTASALAADVTVHEFENLKDAKKQCGAHNVVWINLSSNIYHLEGSADFGNTKNGAYACQDEVEQLPRKFKPAKNGQ